MKKQPRTITGIFVKYAPTLMLVSVLLSPGVGAQEDPGRMETDVDLKWGLEIPVEGGTILNATLYRPDNHEDTALSTIVTITPYISDRYHPDALYFARHGFAFLVVDTRGRGNSEGEFRPLGIEDGLDGRDIVEWVAQQSWSNGKIGMRGGSYGGYNQWVTARYFPEHLTTIVPIASPFNGMDFPMNYNVQYPYILRWLTLTAGATPQNRIFGDDDFWNRKYREYHTSGMAFSDLDELVGYSNPHFDEWTSHPLHDDYWAARVPSQEEFEQIDLPILTITGYYDGDQPGAMEYYQRHMEYGSSKAKANHYLVLGPWDHSGTRMPRQEFGGVQFGDAMMFDAFALDRDWYRWTMENGDRPEFLLDQVTYFVAGANLWKGAQSLDAISNGEMVLHLQSDSGAQNMYESGTLSSSAAGVADIDQYIYDPLDTTKAEIEPSDDYITDQQEVLTINGDGLIYHSLPFDKETEISGYLRFEAWFEMDVPDTDINVTLYEVLPDGTSIALSGETQRARYRHSLSEEKLMQPGIIEHFVFERFYFFSRMIARGSRLRLFIRPSNMVANQRNYNSGGIVAMETADDARIAKVKLHIGPETPSRLVLPVAN
ncbi:MAG TPA: CocE/NonD family hydrolase [Xanthomonadales bacterium]|nr:CocE/NonD family hydrolase [Xanthomonadales bacterium]